MTKKRSKNLFIVFSIILVILLIASFVNFTYPLSVNGNYYSWSNFVSNVLLGEDIGDSYRIVYRAELDDYVSSGSYDSLRQTTMDQLREIVQSEGYKDVTVTSYNDDEIIVQVGNILGYSDYSTITSLIGNPQRIYFSMSDDADASFADWRDIESVEAKDYYDSSTGETTYYIQITFKDSAVDKIAVATADDTTMYIILGDDSTSMTLSDSIDDGIITIQSDSFTSISDANSYANTIRSGMLALKLTNIDSGAITASYGDNAGILLCVALAVFVLAAFVFLIVKYKHMGWLACFNLLFFITIGLMILQSIPVAHINIGGMVALAIAFLLAVDTLMTIFEKAKAHYLAGTKLYVSLKIAQNESLVRIFAKNCLFIILGLVCVFVPSLTIQSMGWVFLIFPTLNLVTSLGLMRLFIKLYLPFNSEDGKKLNFEKGGKQNAN